MNNHLNAIKRFFGFLFKEGMATNVFNQIPDYDLFKQNIIEGCNLKLASERGYFESDQIKELLDYFNSKPKKYSNMTMMGFFLVNSNPRIPFVTQDSLFVNENPVL